MRKLILQTQKRSYLVGLETQNLPEAIVYIFTLCVWAVKAQARLHMSPEPSLLAWTVSTSHSLAQILIATVTVGPADQEGFEEC